MQVHERACTSAKRVEMLTWGGVVLKTWQQGALPPTTASQVGRVNKSGLKRGINLDWAPSWLQKRQADSCWQGGETQQQAGFPQKKNTWLAELLTRGWDVATSLAATQICQLHCSALTLLPLQQWTCWSGHVEHHDPLAQTCHLLGFKNSCKHYVGFCAM